MTPRSANYTVTFTFDLHFLNFNLCHNVWTNRDRAFIFQMCIPCDGTFPFILKFWPSDLDLGLLPTYLKTVTLVITFEFVKDRDFMFGTHTQLTKPYPHQGQWPCDLDYTKIANWVFVAAKGIQFSRMHLFFSNSWGHDLESPDNSCKICWIVLLRANPEFFLQLLVQVSFKSM